MDHNFDMASCTLKEDELLTKTEVREIFLWNRFSGFVFKLGVSVTRFDYNGA